jgi:3-oxoacyl-[acyl-carrier protein] reductase
MLRISDFKQKSLKSATCVSGMVGAHLRGGDPARGGVSDADHQRESGARNANGGPGATGGGARRRRLDAVDAAAEALGGLDILVNNAGIFRSGDIAAMTLGDVDATLAVNVRAVVVASQAASAHMGEGGRIISIGSCLAERVVEPGVSLYALSKAALIGWTKGLARDLGPKGITVNIVHPGSTDTEMNPANGPGAEAQRARMAIPRYGRPEDIAAMVAFVAGPEGRFITGTGLAVDGGVNT